MEQRLIKIGLALAVGLLGGLWCINNLLNWETARGAVAYVLSQDGQSGYSVHIIPAIDSPLAATIGLAIICLAEGAAAVLALAGAWRMWRARRADEPGFAAAKRLAIIGAGIAVLNWFLGFAVIGGAGILMGQAEGMDAAMQGAFRFAAYSFLTLIYLSMAEGMRPAR